jgi:uncharacterized delta-60 repeat protein
VGTSDNGVLHDQGDMAIARFTSGGQLDLSFNGTGKRVENFFVPGTLTNADFAKAVAVQPDAKILVGGTGANIISPSRVFQGGFHLLRYKADGTRDDSFGQNGLVTTTFGITSGSPYITHLQLLNDGRIFALGHETHSRLLMAMYNPDGSADNSFGQNGTVVLEDFANYNANPFFQADGSIRVVAASNYLYDLLFDSHGQLLKDDRLSIPSLGPTIFAQDYYDAIALDDGDILAVGRAAGWMLVTRFERPIPQATVPEPSMALIVLAGGLLLRARVISTVRRRGHR